jgi:hypothetical protein
MDKKYLKKCSISLAIKEIQIKTTLRFHLTLCRMIIIKKQTTTSAYKDAGEKGALLNCWWDVN